MYLFLKERKLTAKLKLSKQITLDSFVEETSTKESEIKSGDNKQTSVQSVLNIPNEITSTDVVIYEEETRMSADTNSRAQTPAKQVSN